MKRLLFGYVLVLASLSYAQTFDVVLANGRVMDPESGLDAVRNVGIRGGRVEAISATPLNGRTVVDVRGLVVAPGFIDLHSHGQDAENYALKAHDGVTTALELEIGVYPVQAWYDARKGKALVNFGASSGHVPARMAVMHDTGDFLPGIRPPIASPPMRKNCRFSTTSARGWTKAPSVSASASPTCPPRAAKKS